MWKQDKIDDLQEKYFEEKFSNMCGKLDAIHTQTLKTNGRVTKLEDETAIPRFLLQHKWVSFCVWFTAMSLVFIKEFRDIAIEILKSFIS